MGTSVQVYFDQYSSASFLLPGNIISRGSTMYVTVMAGNAANEFSAASAPIAVATLPVTMLTNTVEASLTLPGSATDTAGSLTLELRSDGVSSGGSGGSDPILQLGYSVPGSSVFNVIATLPNSLSVKSDRSAALVADPAGNLYVIGIESTSLSVNRLRVLRYARTGVYAWTAGGVLVGDLPLVAPSQPIYRLAAAYATGVAPNAKDSIVVTFTRLGSPGNRVSSAIVNPAAVALSTGSLFLSFSNTPTYLPAASTTPSVDKALSLVPVSTGANGHTFANIGDGYALFSVLNGVVTSIANVKSIDANDAVAPQWDRTLVPIDASRVFVIGSRGDNPSTSTGRDLYFQIISTVNANILGAGSIAATEFQGGDEDRQFDAYYDRVAGLLRVYIIGSAAGARTLKRYDISPDTMALGTTGGTVVTAALGAAGSTNRGIRVPRTPDERKVRVEVSNLLAGAKSIAVFEDVAGNVAPGAPTLVDVTGFDATQAFTLNWANSDANPLDVITAYELQVQRVSDSVNVVSTGKVAAVNPVSRTIAANTLSNPVAYRWRVRVWDGSDVASAYSGYDDFATSAIGTLTITAPVADTTALDVATYNVQWSYAQANGYAQTQRRVRVVNVATAAVLSDTTMQATTTQNYIVALPTGVAVRIEVSIVTNAPSTPTVTQNRLVTSNYLLPMTPTAVLTSGDAWVNIAITNPTPTGSRPVAGSNLIQRKFSGDADGAYVNIGRVASGGTFDDYTPASNTGYDYRIVAIAADGSISASIGYSIITPALIGVWVHDPADPAATCRNYLFASGRTESIEPESAELVAAGRANPLVEFGELNLVGLQLTIFVPFDDIDGVQWWRDRVLNRRPIYYRDNRGRVLIGALPDGIKPVDGRAGTALGLNLRQVTYLPVI